jgi:hypothetical protein
MIVDKNQVDLMEIIYMYCKYFFIVLVLSWVFTSDLTSLILIVIKLFISTNMYN